MKILIIDDDSASSQIYSIAIQKAGFQTLLAATGTDGLDKAKSEHVDLILLDQVLPDISGNEVLKALKQQNKTKNIPVIILSNFSQEELVKQAINEGAVDYVFKYQVDPQDIVKKINQNLSGPSEKP